MEKKNLWITEELLRWIVDQLGSPAKAADFRNRLPNRSWIAKKFRVQPLGYCFEQQQAKA